MIKGITKVFVFIGLIISTSLTSQEIVKVDLLKTNQEQTTTCWEDYMYANPDDLEGIIAKYESYYANNDFIKNQHTQYYKRLLRSHGRGIYNSSLTNEQKVESDKHYLKNRLKHKNNISAWQAIGPKDIDIDAPASGSTPGSAHVYHISACKYLEQHLLAGTATAGLWKSSNDGASWELITHELMVNTVKAASYAPNNPSTIYFSANNTFYKTINGGIDWQNVGGDILSQGNYEAREILIPTNSSIIYLATSKGLFKSINAGEHFELILEGNIQDIAFHPTDDKILYVINQSNNRTIFYRSKDEGVSFEFFESGYPKPSSTEEQKRTVIQVSPAQPDAVWAVAVGKMNHGDGLVGIYKSENQGTSWDRVCCGDEDGGPASADNLNIMEWDCSGTSNGGQYYYDLALGVNPNNQNQIVIGGVNLWLSNDGGTNLSCHSDYLYRNNEETYVHADIHSILFLNNAIWVASDGGIFRSTDGLQSFHKRMNGLHGTDFRGFDVGFYNEEIMLGGTYHNGTMLKEGNTYINEWVSTRSGDNSRAFINQGSNKIVYDHSSIRELSGDRSKPPHNVIFSRKPNASPTPGASSEIVFNPFHSNHIYVGNGGSIYESFNNGVTFERVKTFGNGLVTALEVSSTLDGLLYAVYYPSFSEAKQLWRSTDHGVSWVNVTPSAQLFNNENEWVSFDITVGSHSPYEIWLVRVAQTTTNVDLDDYMVYYSANGGDTWYNFTTDALDGEYPTNIVHQVGSHGGIYLGTRRGVYYRSHYSTDWELQSNGIPASTFSTKLVPHYRSGKLFNATQRGIYSMDFREEGTPVAIAMVDKKSSPCLRDTFYFMDRSTVSKNATRMWTFQGADITTSTDLNPKVTYSLPGVYPVKLEVFDNGSSSTYESLEFIEVSDGCEMEPKVGKSLQVGNNMYAKIPPFKRTFSEMTISCWVKRNGVLFGDSGVVLHRDGPAGTGLMISSNGNLTYRWGELNNGYESHLHVPHNKWAHIALAVDSTGARLYVDGMEEKHTRALGEVELLESFLIGTDAFAISNYVSGSIDEVSIYDRALSLDEIRLSMNLTHNSAPLGLISYFQANNEDGLLTDRKGFSHALLMGQATRVQSKAPVSGGCADMKIINSPGTYNFDCPGVSITFLPGDLLPYGPVSVNKLDELPELPAPYGTRISEHYYVFNNFGALQNFSPPSQLKFSDFGQVDSIYQYFPDIYHYYMVPTYWEYGWGNPLDQADSVSLENNTELIFDVSDGMNYFGKLILTEEGLPTLALNPIHFEGRLMNDEIVLEWSGIEEGMQYDIMRSFNGKDWLNIHSGIANNYDYTTDFHEFIDQPGIQQHVYYYLHVKDEEGREKESEIIRFDLDYTSSIQFYPNVIASGQEVSVIHNFDEEVIMNAFDIHGRLVINKKLGRKENYFNPSLLGGIYFIEFRVGSHLEHATLVVN